MRPSQARRAFAIVFAVAALAFLASAPGALASSGTITNVHAVGEQVQATYTVNYDSCEGTSCFRWSAAYQYPSSRQCAADGEHPTWVGELHTGTSGPIVETKTETFYPKQAGPIRICLYLTDASGNAASGTHLLAQAVYNPPSFGPAHISFDRRCYREGDRVHMTGRGFKPEGIYTVSFSRGPKSVDAFTNSKGSFTNNLPAPDISSLSPPPPLQRRVGVHVEEYAPLVPGGPEAGGSFLVTTVAVATSPSLPVFGDIPRRVSFVLSGFDSGRKIYAHWRHRGRSAGTEKLGRAGGPCGELRTARMPFRERIDGRGGWTIQFDQRRAYSPLKEPEAHLSFTVFTTYGRVRAG